MKTIQSWLIINILITVCLLNCSGKPYSPSYKLREKIINILTNPDYNEEQNDVQTTERMTLQSDYRWPLFLKRNMPLLKLLQTTTEAETTTATTNPNSKKLKRYTATNNKALNSIVSKILELLQNAVKA